MIDFIQILLIVSLFSILGGLFAKLILKKFQKHQKYALLAALFLTIIIISELMKEGFAVSGLVTFSLVAGAGFLYFTKKFHKKPTNFTRELPKIIAFASSFAIALDLGKAIAILLAIYNIPQGGLFALPSLIKKKTNRAFQELSTLQFKFIITSIIVFVIVVSLNRLFQAYILTFAAGMMLFTVIEEGVLLKK